MSKTNAWETGTLYLTFNNDVSGANNPLADAMGLRGSLLPGSLYLALGVAGMSTEAIDITRECGQSAGGTYTGYARIAVARATGGWSVAGDTAANVAAITFAASQAPDNSLIADFAICTGGTAGVDDVTYYGTLSASLQLAGVGTTPEFTNASDITVTEG